MNILTINGTSTLGANITTAGAQNFVGNVVISGTDVSLSSMGNAGTGGAITFSGNIDGTTANVNNLYMLSGSAEINVSGNVGNTIALGYFGLGGTGTYSAGVNQNFSYTGSAQAFTVPTTGIYTLQVWGAQGGNDPANPTTVFGGRGGYSTGQLTLQAGTTIYIYVGGQGTGSTSSTWNSTGGGGATDVRLVGGAWNDSAGLLSRIIVAGGGGGRHGKNYEAAAYIGNDGGGLSAPSYTTNGVSVVGASQTSGGSSNYGCQSGCVVSGAFGYAIANGQSNTYSAGGWNGGGNGSDNWANGGAGGGWYGGVTTWSTSSGGSGYVLTSTSVKPTGYSPGSSYYMTSTQLIAGNAVMPNPSGGTMTGRSGNGYASITTPGGASFTAGAQTGKIKINGAIKVSTLKTANTAYDLELVMGNVNSTIASATTFNNTGALILGSAGSTKTLTISGALVASSASSNNVGVSITTSDAQTYGVATTLNTDVTLNSSSGNGNVTFSSTLNSVTSSRALTITAGTGTVTFTGAVGGTLALGATSITAASVVNSSTLVGSSTYAVTGNATFSGAVSGVTNLSVSGTTAINANITTTGTQGYTGNATLGADLTLASGNGNITFSGTLNSVTSSRTLTITAGTGTVTFTGAVGGTLALGATSITAASAAAPWGLAANR